MRGHGCSIIYGLVRQGIVFLSFRGGIEGVVFVFLPVYHMAS
jgi:hypothetical protein